MSRRRAAAVVMAVFAMSAPYAVAGPGFFLDDWFALRAGRLDEWYLAAGSDQWRARPGAGVIYALTFGLLQDRPSVYFGLATLLIAVAAVLVLVVATRFAGSTAIGSAIALVWLVAPNHTSLEMWPSALNILVALVLLLLGAELLTRPAVDTRSAVVAALLLGLGTLSYEPVAPTAIAVVVVIAWRHQADVERWWLLAAGLGVQCTCLAWMIVHWHPAKRSIDRWIAPDRVLAGQVADGVFGDWLVGRVFGVLVLIVLMGLVGRRLLRGCWADPRVQPLFLGGTAIVLLGALPFLRYFYAPIGFGDRVTVVSSLGGACLLVAIGLELRTLSPRPALAGFMIATGLAVGWRTEMVATYATAADDGRRILGEVRRRFPVAPDEALVFGPEPILEHNVGAFLQFDWPVQWLYGSPDPAVVTTSSVEEFEAADPDLRFDIDRLSRLQDNQAP